jgi:plasmid maintenance system killer protein
LEIGASTNKLEKIISSSKKLKKQFGTDIANRIQQRITEFQAADTLSDISHLPPARLHALSGNRKDCFAVDVSANVRLIFQGLDEDYEITTDKTKAIKIYIKEVRDYHGN